ncbi:MAG: hypothetical protein KA778_06285, partial [Burkholderiaceae bacterium]|nr:hypothetical protein [Burkholderiaceae bacterium]
RCHGVHLVSLPVQKAGRLGQNTLVNFQRAEPSIYGQFSTSSNNVKPNAHHSGFSCLISLMP